MDQIPCPTPDNILWQRDGKIVKLGDREIKCTLTPNDWEMYTVSYKEEGNYELLEYSAKQLNKYLEDFYKEATMDRTSFQTVFLFIGLRSHAQTGCWDTEGMHVFHEIVDVLFEKNGNEDDYVYWGKKLLDGTEVLLPHQCSNSTFADSDDDE